MSEPRTAAGRGAMRDADPEDREWLLERILATEAESAAATVGRIRQRLNEKVSPTGDCDWANKEVSAILDEEAVMTDVTSKYVTLEALVAALSSCSDMWADFGSPSPNELAMAIFAALPAEAAPPA